MPESQKPSPRYLELDVLRGVAALFVVCFHFNADYGATYGVSFKTTLFNFQMGTSGVHLFFMISGFVILMTLERTSRILDFIVSRFSRLYPAYWASIIVLYLAMKNLPLLPAAVSPKTVLVNFSMFQYWFHVADISSVYWTLSVELSFYILMALAFVTRGLKYVELFWALWLVIMVLNKFFAPAWAPLVFLKFFFWGLLKYGHLFFLGILFYGLKTKGNRWYRHLAIGLCLLVQNTIFMDNEVYTTPCDMVFVMLFYLFVMGRLKCIIQKPLLFFGTISYSLYLVHQNIGWIILQWLYLFNAGDWVRFVVPMACCILVATGITYFVEKPAMKYIREVYKDWKKILIFSPAKC